MGVGRLLFLPLAGVVKRLGRLNRGDRAGYRLGNPLDRHLGPGMGLLGHCHFGHRSVKRLGCLGQVILRCLQCRFGRLTGLALGCCQGLLGRVGCCHGSGMGDPRLFGCRLLLADIDFGLRDLEHRLIEGLPLGIPELDGLLKVLPGVGGELLGPIMGKAELIQCGGRIVLGTLRGHRHQLRWQLAADECHPSGRRAREHVTAVFRDRQGRDRPTN